MRVCLCVLPEAAAGPGQAIGVDGLETGRDAVRALGRNLVKSPWSWISPWSSSPSREVPPHLSSLAHLRLHSPLLSQVCLSKVVSFGLSRLGRFPGTAKPKAKSEQGTGSHYGRGSSAVWFFYRWDLSSPPPLFFRFSSTSRQYRPRRFPSSVCLDAVLLSRSPGFSCSSRELSCA